MPREPLEDVLANVVKGVGGVILDTNVAVDAFLGIAAVNFSVPRSANVSKAEAIADMLLEFKRALADVYIVHVHDGLIAEYRRHFEKVLKKLGVLERLSGIPHCGFTRQLATAVCGNKGMCRFLSNQLSELAPKLKCVNYYELREKDGIKELNKVYDQVTKLKYYRSINRELPNKDFESFHERVTEIIETGQDIPDKFVDVLNVFLGYEYRLLVITRDEGTFEACKRINEELHLGNVACAFVKSIERRDWRYVVTVNITPSIRVGTVAVKSFKYLYLSRDNTVELE